MPKLKQSEPKPEEVISDKTEVIEPPKPQTEVIVENTGIPAKIWPNINGGTCAFCGVMVKDPRKGDDTAWHQYRHCPHYKGVDVRCIYCPAGTDMEDVIKGRTIKVRERLNPDGTPSGILTMWCSDTKCETAHWNRTRGSERII